MTINRRPKRPFAPYVRKAGMRYGYTITAGKGDLALLNHFKSLRILLPWPTTWKIIYYGKNKLQEAFVAMFDAAIKPAIGSLIGADNDMAAFEHAVQQEVEWARDGAVDPRLFAELFHALVAARQRWLDSPTEPHNREDHCELAKAISRYLEDQADWGRQMARLLGQASPSADGEMKEEEAGQEAMDGVQNQQTTTNESVVNEHDMMDME